MIFVSTTQTRRSEGGRRKRADLTGGERSRQEVREDEETDNLIGGWLVAGWLLAGYWLATGWWLAGWQGFWVPGWMESDVMIWPLRFLTRLRPEP